MTKLDAICAAATPSIVSMATQLPLGLRAFYRLSLLPPHKWIDALEELKSALSAPHLFRKTTRLSASSALPPCCAEERIERNA